MLLADCTLVERAGHFLCDLALALGFHQRLGFA